METKQPQPQDAMTVMINPFSTAVKSPKLLDGKILRSAGLKLRATGEIVCSTSGVTTIILLPGISNSICWAKDGTIFTPPSAFTGHVGTPQDRANVKMARLVASGLRLNLTNNADSDDGYWEAARIAVDLSDFSLNGDGSMVVYPAAVNTNVDLANNETYMTGRNRDLHQFIFKLNSFTTEHPFSSIKPIIDLDQLLDQTWDLIIIKIHGRTVENSPSVLMYDTISNQELIYQENTSLARLMSTSPRDPNFQAYLNYSKIDLPAFKV
jgi:hypothetical protein